MPPLAVMGKMRLPDLAVGKVSLNAFWIIVRIEKHVYIFTQQVHFWKCILQTKRAKLLQNCLLRYLCSGKHRKLSKCSLIGKWINIFQYYRLKLSCHRSVTIGLQNSVQNYTNKVSLGPEMRL